MAILGNRRSLTPLWMLASLLGCGPLDPTVTLSPADWSFGTVAYGAQVSETVHITNTSGYPIHVLDDPISNRDPRLGVTGLPVENLEPGKSADIQLTVRPNFSNVSEVFSASVQLVFGGHAGGTQGNSTEGVVFLDVSGSIPSVVAPVCAPGPDGENSGMAELPSVAETEWFQEGYACTSSPAGDQPDAGAKSCQSASDCPQLCCACATDCATFNAQTCIFGTCARLPVACDYTRAVASAPVLCPDGGLVPSSVLGGLGFGVGGSGVAKSSTATITLARDASSACLGAGAAPGLSFFLASASSSLQNGFFPIGAGTSAILDDPAQGALDATTGYLLLTSVRGGSVAGSFDVTFPGADGEVWGAIDAAYCP